MTSYDVMVPFQPYRNESMSTLVPQLIEQRARVRWDFVISELVVAHAGQFPKDWHAALQRSDVTPFFIPFSAYLRKNIHNTSSDSSPEPLYPGMAWTRFRSTAI